MCELGAWWLGWVIFGICMLILAGLIGMFPENLKNAQADAELSDTSEKVQVEKVEVETSLSGARPA